MVKAKKHATCSACGKEMKPGNGCTISHYKEPDGKAYPRIKHGMGSHDQAEEDSICHDCNAGYNQFHHPGCDWERCPHCGVGQAIGCYCSKSQKFDKMREKAG